MAETVSCPGCQTKLKLKPEYAGRKIKCPRCAHVLVIPAAPGVTATPPKAIKKAAAGSAAPPLPPPAPKTKGRALPEDEEAAVATEPKGKRKGRKSDLTPCPECGEMVDNEATKCPHCKTLLEVDDEEEYLQWKKCPSCGAQRAKRVLWTFWGSFYFTAIFKHVKCQECGTAYNGRTGKSNLVPALLCVGITLLMIGGIVGAVLWMLHDRGRL